MLCGGVVIGYFECVVIVVLIVVGYLEVLVVVIVIKGFGCFLELDNVEVCEWFIIGIFISFLWVGVCVVIIVLLGGLLR